MICAATPFRRRLLALAYGCLALVAVSGCTSDPPPERPVAAPTETTARTPDEPSASPSPSPEETPGPYSTDVCVGKRPYNPGAARYAGEGPHRMTIVQHDPAYGKLELRYVLLPDGWDPTVDGDSTKRDLDRIELVICHDAVPIGRTMGTCEFDQPGMSGTMDVVPADHTFVVREARTGREVTRFGLRGNTGLEDSCPSVAMDSGGTMIAQAVDDDTVTAKLRSPYKDPAR